MHQLMPKYEILVWPKPNFLKESSLLSGEGNVGLPFFHILALGTGRSS